MGKYCTIAEELKYRIVNNLAFNLTEDEEMAQNIINCILEDNINFAVWEVNDSICGYIQDIEANNPEDNLHTIKGVEKFQYPGNNNTDNRCEELIGDIIEIFNSVIKLIIKKGIKNITESEILTAGGIK